MAPLAGKILEITFFNSPPSTKTSKRADNLQEENVLWARQEAFKKQIRI